MEKYGIESHKLIYHPERVAQWLRGENIYPICVELGPAGCCNHRCIFCAFDYLEYKGPLVDKDVMRNTLSDIALHGVKSVSFAGEGESLLHPNISEFINYSKGLGLDVAVSTNGVLFNSELAEQCLSSLTWIRFSVDAGTKDTYSKIHRCNSSDFDKVISNIGKAVEIKHRNNYNCTIGIQAILLSENYNDMTTLASLARNLGVDYLTIKPFSKHPSSICDVNFNYKNFSYLEDELEKFNTNDFGVIFRTHAMKKLEEEKPYKQCFGLYFATCTDSYGNIYVCNTFLGNKEFCYGNIYEQSFSQIWEGEKRKEVLNKMTKFRPDGCREACRLDEINCYLWKLKNPPEHVNFI